MDEIGALLARYHATAEQIRMPGQRPSTLPLAQVPGVLMSALDSAGVAGHHSTVIRKHADQLSRHLSEIAPMDRELAVIHGDFTNDNVIASGNPPAATGVIDFALAHRASPGRHRLRAVAQRTSSRARHLPGPRPGPRVRARLPRRQAALTGSAAAIPTYMFGRGLQMIAKRVRARRPDIGMLPEVQWISENHQVLTDVIQRAIGR